MEVILEILINTWCYITAKHFCIIDYVVYGNGVEIGRLESSRICNVPSYVILYMVSGGWANVPIEDEKLPDEFQIDWIRVWQREDMK